MPVPPECQCPARRGPPEPNVRSISHAHAHKQASRVKGDSGLPGTDRSRNRHNSQSKARRSDRRVDCACRRPSAISHLAWAVASLTDYSPPPTRFATKSRGPLTSLQGRTVDPQDLPGSRLATRLGPARPDGKATKRHFTKSNLMDGRPTAAESKHHYQPNPWPRATSGPSTPRVNTSSTGDSTPAYFSPPLELFPLLFPQQAFDDKILQYNQLVSAGRGGGGLRTSSNPAASTAHQKPAARSRSSSKVSTKGHLHAKTGAQSGHGNRATGPSDITDRASIAPATDPPVKMPHTTTTEVTTGHALPVRLPPSSASNGIHPAAQSSSVPSTPSQHPRKFSCESREHSPGATQNHSPRSAYSETNGNVPSLRPLPPRAGGCRFEFQIPTSRRRIPYSIGSDRLEKLDDADVKKSLSQEDEAKLEADMQKLYRQLLPTPEIETKRKKLVQKLETLFNRELKRKDIRVHLFGSSGNLLCSDDSDGWFLGSQALVWTVS